MRWLLCIVVGVIVGATYDLWYPVAVAFVDGLSR